MGPPCDVRSSASRQERGLAGGTALSLPSPEADSPAAFRGLPPAICFAETRTRRLPAIGLDRIGLEIDVEAGGGDPDGTADLIVARVDDVLRVGREVEAGRQGEGVKALGNPFVTVGQGAVAE